MTNYALAASRPTRKRARAMSDDVRTLIIREIEALNPELEVSVDLEDGNQALLFAEGGPLSSLELVTLLVAVEQAVEDHLGVSISLADDRAMSQERSPFHSIGTLVEYASLLVGEHA